MCCSGIVYGSMGTPASLAAPLGPALQDHNLLARFAKIVRYVQAKHARANDANISCEVLLQWGVAFSLQRNARHKMLIRARLMFPFHRYSSRQQCRGVLLVMPASELRYPHLQCGHHHNQSLLDIGKHQPSTPPQIAGSLRSSLLGCLGPRRCGRRRERRQPLWVQPWCSCLATQAVEE